MCIELDRLIELAKVLGTTDAEAVKKIVAAQDSRLQIQKAQAESSRVRDEVAWPILSSPLSYCDRETGTVHCCP
jgi:hypothetical protein